MNRDEATKVLMRVLGDYEAREYAELAPRVGELRCFHVVGDSGARYQVEVQLLWDGPRNGLIRVSGGIDDGGWSAWRPLSGDIIVESP